MAGSMCSASLLCLLEAHTSSARLASSLKALWHYFTGATQEVLTSAAVCLRGLPATTADIPPMSSPLRPSRLCAAPYRAQRSSFTIRNIQAEAVRGCYAPYSKRGLHPRKPSYLVHNEESPISLPRVNKGVSEIVPGKSGSVKENTGEPTSPY